jgi:hypothetical protein
MGKDMGMKIENGKRYNTRFGEVDGPMNVPPIGKWRGNVIADWDDHGWCEGGKFRTDGKTDSRDLISEYIEPATAPDMSQNRVPWGLLTDVEQAALHAWVSLGMPIEVFRHRGFLPMQIAQTISPHREDIYRTVSPPVITEERHDITTASGQLVTVTMTLHDGKPISGTVAV